MSTSRSKSKTDSRRRGGALLGQGTYGCVFGPALACQQKKIPSTSVSKVFSLENESNIQDEIRIAQIMNDVDPESEFTVKYYGTCDIDLNKVTENITNKCDVVNFRKYKEYHMKVPQIIYANGGMDLDQLCTAYALKHRVVFDDLIISMIRVMKGIATICKKRFAHFDIKPANMLYNEKERRMYLVDFGLAQKITGIDIADIDFMMSASYLYYPPEFRIMSRILNGIPVSDVPTQFLNDTISNSGYVERYASSADRFAHPFVSTLNFVEKDLRAMVVRAQNNHVAFTKAFKTKYLYKIDVYSFGMTMLEVIYTLSHNTNTKGIAFHVKNHTFVHEFKDLLRDMVSVDPEKRPSAKDAYKRAAALVAQYIPADEKTEKRRYKKSAKPRVL